MANDDDSDEKFNILSLVSWKSLIGSVDDDWVDRMNHKWTVTILMMSAMFVSTSQYIGHPIQCWCPAEFKKWQRRYVRNYCWVSNTYRMQMNDVIPIDKDLHREAELSYYQWIPIMLLCQAFLFKLPYIMWHLMNPACGINLSRLCKFIDQLQAESTDDRNEALYGISQYLDRWLVVHRAYNKSLATRVKRILSRTFFFCCGQRFGVFLSGLYLFTKVTYLVNVGLQLWLINEFLGIDMFSYGTEILRCFFSETCKPVASSSKFPRVTLCDFEIRQLQNIQPYTVQCVLPINLFNEKIYLLLWIWLLVVGGFTCLNLILWFKFMLLRSSRQNFVKKYLEKELESKADLKLLRSFADKYLRHDGCFLVRIVQRNTSDVTVKDLVRHLWEVYKRPLEDKFDDTSGAPKEGIEGTGK